MANRNMNLAEVMRRVLNEESYKNVAFNKPIPAFVSQLRIDASLLLPKSYTVQIVFTADAEDEIELFKRIASITQICIEEK